MYELASLWDRNYKNGRLNRYPFDSIVSFVFQEFGIDKNDLQQLSALEVGFGGGNNLKFLDDLGVDWRGIDAAPSAKLFAEKLLNLSNDDRLIVKDFTNLPYENEKFDMVIDRQSIGHNDSSNLNTILSEVQRVLKPGGKFFSVVFGKNTTDLKFGQSRGNNTFDNFKLGNFANSGLLTVFNEEAILERYGNFFDILKIGRQLSEDLEAKSVIEQYEIKLQKKL